MVHVISEIGFFFVNYFLIKFFFLKKKSYLAALFQKLVDDKKFKSISWNFFAEYHGKNKLDTHFSQVNFYLNIL